MSAHFRTALRATALVAVVFAVVPAAGQDVPGVNGPECVESPFGCPGGTSGTTDNDDDGSSGGWSGWGGNDGSDDGEAVAPQPAPRGPSAADVARRRAAEARARERARAQERARRLVEACAAADNRGDLSGALAKCRAAAKVVPRDRGLQTRIARLEALVLRREASTLIDQSKYEEAVAKLRAAAKRDGRDVVRAELAWANGYAARRRDACRLAVAFFDEAVHLDPALKNKSLPPLSFAAEEIEQARDCVRFQSEGAAMRAAEDLVKSVRDRRDRAVSRASSLADSDRLDAAIAELRSSLDELRKARDSSELHSPFLTPQKSKAHVDDVMREMSSVETEIHRYEKAMKVLAEMDAELAAVKIDHSYARLRHIRDLRAGTDVFLPALHRYWQALMVVVVDDPDQSISNRILALRLVVAFESSGPLSDEAARRLAELEASVDAGAGQPRMPLPMPPPESNAWKASSQPAAEAEPIQLLTPEQLETLKAVRAKFAKKLEEKIKEKIKEEIRDAVVETIPIDEVIKAGLMKKVEMIQEFKEHYQRAKDSTNTYILRWQRTATSSVVCLASPRADCMQEMLEAQQITDRYAFDRTSELPRWVVHLMGEAND